MFSFEFVVWGNYVYIKRSVDFIYGGSLPCWAETWNIHDLYTIAVEQDGAIVGHFAQNDIYPMSSLFTKGR